MCNNACTASNAANVIDALGNGVLAGNIMKSSDIMEVKNALVKEFTRRGRNDYSTYSVPIAVGTKILVEHGQKILEDTHKLGSADWRNNIYKGKAVLAADLTPAIEYTKTLMRTIVPVA